MFLVVIMNAPWVINFFLCSFVIIVLLNEAKMLNISFSYSVTFKSFINYYNIICNNIIGLDKNETDVSMKICLTSLMYVLYKYFYGYIYIYIYVIMNHKNKYSTRRTSSTCFNFMHEQMTSVNWMHSINEELHHYHNDFLFYTIKK